MIKGDRLKKLRKEAGLTQEKLGDLLGVKKSVICLYEKELRNPTIESIIELIQIFNVSADYLIGADCLVKTITDEPIKTVAMTKEEVEFIEDLKKNKMIYNTLLLDPKRGIEIIKNRVY